MVYSYPVVYADMACNERGGEGESRTYRGNSIHNMVKHEGLLKGVRLTFFYLVQRDGDKGNGD